MSTELYRKYAADDGALSEVWRDVPWMVDAYTGSLSSDCFIELYAWCRDKFGLEAQPFIGKPGNWYTGCVTFHGWTWIGFKTEEMLRQFEAKWPSPEKGPTP